MSTILVIDDTPEIHGLIRSSVPDCTILSALNGKAGLEMLRDRRDAIDLVILDLKFDGQDFNGQAVLLRISRLCPETPVLVFSGFADAASEDLIEELTGYPPLSKPQPLEEITARIYERIGRKANPIPTSAALQYLQNVAYGWEMNVLPVPPLTQVLLCGPDNIVKSGLKGFLEPALSDISDQIRYMYINAVHSEQFSACEDPIVAVTLTNDFKYVLPSNMPVMCICTGIIDAIRVLDQVEEFVKEFGKQRTVAIIVYDEDNEGNSEPSPEIQAYTRSAFDKITRGRSQIPDQLYLPVSDVEGKPISPMEARLLRYEIVGRDTKDIASKLVTTADAVRKMRSRLAKKLKAPVGTWQNWVEKWWDLQSLK